MNKSYLLNELNAIKNAMRIYRQQVAHLVIDNKTLFYPLLEVTFNTSDKISIKAAWVLELVCESNIDLLAPHLSYFCNNLNKVSFDSAVRPVSKINLFIAKAYFQNTSTAINKYLKDEHIRLIIETGFDWLITNQKVATKVYAMEMLFYLGYYKSWVHPELKLIIEQNMAFETCGYQARGKKILHKINKL